MWRVLRALRWLSAAQQKQIEAEMRQRVYKKKLKTQKKEVCKLRRERKEDWRELQHALEGYEAAVGYRRAINGQLTRNKELRRVPKAVELAMSWCRRVDGGNAKEEEKAQRRCVKFQSRWFSATKEKLSAAMAERKLTGEKLNKYGWKAAYMVQRHRGRLLEAEARWRQREACRLRAAVERGLNAIIDGVERSRQIGATIENADPLQLGLR